MHLRRQYMHLIIAAWKSISLTASSSSSEFRYEVPACILDGIIVRAMHAFSRCYTQGDDLSNQSGAFQEGSPLSKAMSVGETWICNEMRTLWLRLSN